MKINGQILPWRPEADFAVSNKSNHLACGVTFTYPAKSLTVLGGKLHRGKPPQASPPKKNRCAESVV